MEDLEGLKGKQMKFTETKLKGAYVIEIEPLEDERGFFSRCFCKKEFEKLGLNSDMVQSNISFNHKAGTLRGMHYQKPPYEEVKIVSCHVGAIYDVIVDIRPASETYLQWFGVELSAENHKMLYIPTEFAHGYQTLVDKTLVFYAQGYEAAISWNDPLIGIKWPECENRIISEKDSKNKTFNEFKEKYQ